MKQRPLTTAEAAARANVSARMMRHYAKQGRIVPVDRTAATMLFDIDDVDALAESIERRWRRPAPVASASLGVFGAAVVVPEGGALPGYVGLLAAGALAVGAVVIGVRELLSRRPAAPGSPVPAGMAWVEWAALEIDAASVHVCPHRGRVYSALNGEFWRSSLDGSWLFAQGARIEQVDPTVTVVWRALNRRDARERLSVVA
jgi:hypothetical protein